LGDRRWLADGVVDAGDRVAGSIVSNLPAGSVYTTVREDRTQGSIYLPRAGEAREVALRFVDGAIVAVETAEGGATLTALLDRHGGDARRAGHLGIGLNPQLQDRSPLGWVLVDEHIHGTLFLSLGENRYIGGQNASTLNIDYVVPGRRCWRMVRRWWTAAQC
jgi:leucyl aminopeptidase (aminopeptidase T)